MKKGFILYFLFLSVVLHAQSMREQFLLNQDWKFTKGHAADAAKDFNYGQALSFSKIAFLQESTLLNADQESRLRIPHTQQFNDSTWTDVSIPHDWGMALGYDKEQFKVKGYRTLGGRSPENSIGWYRKTFKPTLQPGSRYTLTFEGIFRDAQVWMNGIYLGRGESGYIPLDFDVTECLNYGPGAENVISVRVDATHSELWSYEGAGIYRNVWLTQTSPVHVAKYGTFVTTDVDLTTRNARVNIAVEVANESANSAGIVVRNRILDPMGNVVVTEEQPVQIASLEQTEVTMHLPVSEARLWSLNDPALYMLQTEISAGGKLLDVYNTKFGIRSIRFDANEGFFLNGEHVLIKGVCCHQDHAGVGIGVPDRLNVWRIEKLKEMGANAYRASHNPPTESILQACDSLGMLVLDECRVLSSSDEGLNQMKTLIRRDRNHPSVILWCLGNEEPAIQGSEKGRLIIERMKAIQHKLDSTRLCTAAMNGSWGEGFTRAVGVQGSNYYKIGNLDEVHKNFPELPCLLTEEASTVTTRGIYETIPDSGFHQAYDRDHPGWGATAQEWMRYADARKYIAGAFVWTGFDYGGESVMHYWPGVVSHFGLMDYCGFPKDAYWYYKAWWSDEPVLHVLPHWNGIGKDSVDVHVYTNMDETELFLNGKSQGVRTVGKFDIPSWKLPYVPGRIEVKGKKNGKKYNTRIETTDKPSAIQLLSETGDSIAGDGNDISVITVKVTDKKGRLVPDASDKICFSVKNGRILGVGNGHPSSQEPDVFTSGETVYRNAFGGLVQVILCSDRSGLPIELTAVSEGLQTGKLQLQIQTNP